MKSTSNIQAQSSQIAVPANETKRELNALGDELKSIDQTMLACVARRLEVSRKVYNVKQKASPGKHPTIVRRDKEKERVTAMAELATQLGVEPQLAAAIEYLIIAESVKVQTELAQSDFVISPPERAVLRANLLELTAKVAASYSKPTDFHGDCPATTALRRFETATITSGIGSLEFPRGLIVDIGCANGHELSQHVGRFSRGLGIDVSPAMVDAAIAASQNEQARRSASRATYLCVDVEESGIPIRDAEASFVIMNNGTGSDVFDLKPVLSEVKRVLRPGGRFFVSFYNAASVVAKGAPLPWISSFGSTLDPERGTLRIRLSDGRTIEILGRAYSREQVEAAMPSGLQITSTLTYPHVLSLLPPGVLSGNAKLRAAIERIDALLATGSSENGAYLMVSGVKI